MKAQKHTAKAKVGEAKGSTQPMKHNMKATVPAGPTLNVAP
jgi:hypothetical protein